MAERRGRGTRACRQEAGQLAGPDWKQPWEEGCKAAGSGSLACGPALSDLSVRQLPAGPPGGPSRRIPFRVSRLVPSPFPFIRRKTGRALNRGKRTCR